MLILFELVRRRGVAQAIVAVALLLTVVLAFFARKVEQDGNVLAFLPENSSEVRTFQDVSARFGSLDVALVAVAHDDVFEAAFLGRLKTATKTLNQTEGIDYALSLTSVEDFHADESGGGITTDYLVRELPKTPEEAARLRTRVLGNHNVVGNLVARDGGAVMIFCFLPAGSNPRDGANKVRRIVDEAFPNDAKYWGGNPFISTYIYELTQEDLGRLAPWACLAIVFLVVLSFRDVWGMLLALTSTGASIVITLGIMGVLGIKSNLVLGSMPVILFALGSAFGVHILARYYGYCKHETPEDALRTTLVQVGPVVIASAFTTIAGVFSFATMDIAPMRSFGIFTALGLFLELVAGVVVVPAAIVAFKIRGRSVPQDSYLFRWTITLSRVAASRRTLVGVALLAVFAVFGLGVLRVDPRTDNSSFFHADSEPALADRFLAEHFGGSQFLQVLVEADLTDPHILREVAFLAEELAAVPGVSGANHLGQVLSTTNEAMEGVKRLPDTPEKAKLLYGFLTGKRAVLQLVTEDRKSALINLKVEPSDLDGVEKVIASVENVLRTSPVQAFVLESTQGPRASDVSERLRVQVARHVFTTVREQGFSGDFARVEAAVRQATTSATLDPQDLAKELTTFVASEEFMGDLAAALVPPDATPDAPTPDAPKTDGAEDEVAPKPEAAKPLTQPELARRVGEAAARFAMLTGAEGTRVAQSEPALAGAIARELGRAPNDPAMVDIAHGLHQEVLDRSSRLIRQGQAKAIAKETGLTLDAANEKILGDALSDLSLGSALLPDASGKIELKTTLTGQPLLYRGLSRSVSKNQITSLLVSLALVLLTTTLLFRSLISGITATTPILFTIVVVYGGMGFFGVHLDIGTSMLASLVVGAGVDYAIHYLSAWRAGDSEPPEHGGVVAASITGPGVWTNALMVSVGFFVLALGRARPLQLVGSLTSMAMLVASFSTFVLLPVVARRRRYFHPTSQGPRP